MKKLLLTLLGVFVIGLAVAQQGNHWSPISGTQYNMTVKGVIVIDGIQQANNMLEIGAFCGDECRGSRKATLFPPTGDYIVTLAIVSNVVSGETITFRIYDHNAQQELELESLSTLIFADNTNAGDPTNWFQIAFATPTPPGFHFITSGNWSVSANWQDGERPGASDEVFIDANCSLDQDATVASLTINDGAVLTLQSGNILTVTGDLTNTAVTGLVIEDGAQVINESANVKATAQKSISAYTAKDSDGWYTISSPVDEMAIAGSDFLTPAYDLYRYNENPESGLEWENYKDNSNVDFTTFENGRGYLYANSNTFSPTFVGTLNAASVARTLTCSESPDGLSGFNLIGNPFPHAIYKGEGGAIDNANLASGFYSLNNEGAWRVNTFEDAIMPGQGILVKTTANTNLTIVKSNTEATAESNGAKNAIGRVCVTVTGGNGEDRAFVYFGQGIGLNKMRGFTDQTPILWVRDNNTDYAIAHVGKGCESLDLFFHNKNNGEFRLSVNTKDITFGVLQLVDNLTGEIIDLKQHPDYSFHANGNEADGRFKLVFRLPSGVEETAEAEPFAFVIDGRIVLVDVDELAELQVVDMTGRIVSKDGLTPGIYVLRLTNGNETRTQKIVVK